MTPGDLTSPLASTDPLASARRRASSVSNAHEFGLVIPLEASEPTRGASRRLRQAVSVRASMRHPNLVPAWPLGHADGRLFVVLERPSHQTLAERLSAAPLEPAECVRILDGAAAGATALRERGLAPRDVTPENVLVHPADGGVLMDLGIPPGLLRRASSGDDPRLEFDSPQEDCVYALGAVLFTALTGVQPNVGADNGRSAPSARKPPLPSERRADLTPEIDQVVARAMATDPAERYADVRELSRAAATALGLNGAPASPPSNGNPRARRPRGPSPDRGSATPPQRNGRCSDSTLGSEAPPTPSRSRARPSLDLARQRPSSPAVEARTTRKTSKTAAMPTHARRALAAAGRRCVDMVLTLVAVAMAAGERLRRRVYRLARAVTPAARTVGSGIAGLSRRSAEVIQAMLAATGRVRAEAARWRPSSPRAEARTTPKASSAAAMSAQARRALAAAGRRGIEMVVALVAVAVAAGERLWDRIHRLAGSVKPAATRVGSAIAGLARRSADVVLALLAAIRRSVGTAARRCRELAARVAHGLHLRVLRRSDLFRRSKPALLAVCALAACALAGTAIGGAMDAEEGPSSVARSGMTVQLPPGWEEASVDAGTSAISPVLAAARSGESRAGLVVGKVGSQAVAQRLLDAKQVDGQGRTPVRLGSLYAWRYAELRPRRHLVGSGYVVPTTAGAVVLICHAASNEARVRLDECERAATTLSIRAERPRPLAALSRSEERLIEVIATLRSSRSEARRRLAVADEPQGQVHAATALKLSYLRAARSLEGLPPMENGRRLDGVSGDLHDAAAASGRLADAAETGRGSAYREAGHELILEEDEIRRELARASGA
jgi:hypothetical protein